MVTKPNIKAAHFDTVCTAIFFSLTKAPTEFYRPTQPYLAKTYLQKQTSMATLFCSCVNRAQHSVNKLTLKCKRYIIKYKPMFRHKGRSRTDLHNLKLATLFSFVAGIVNITGFLAVQRLTTNVTGHFAYFADEVVHNQLFQAFIYALYILSFLLGAFISNLAMEIVAKKNYKFIYLLPVNLEISILLAAALLPASFVQVSGNLLACGLLFSMGLQNALVTGISNAVVRTTHLTGLFTDLGIELSQLFFYKEPAQVNRLWSSIRLRLSIIACFFAGCIAGGFGYFHFQRMVLLLDIACLVTGLFYDTIRFKIVTLRRRRSQ